MAPRFTTRRVEVIEPLTPSCSACRKPTSPHPTATGCFRCTNPKCVEHFLTCTAESIARLRARIEAKV